MLRVKQDTHESQISRDSQIGIGNAVSKRKPSSSQNLSRIIRILFEVSLITTIVILIQTLQGRKQDISHLISENSHLSKRVSEAESQLADANARSSHIEGSDREGPLELERKYQSANNEVQELRRKFNELEKQAKGRNKALERMQKYLSDSMRDQCQKTYPDGPAHVLIATNQGEMEIEMAPCDVMPVVTMHFLQQVRDGFWDGMVFFRAESHVIQATNMRPDGSHIARPKYMRSSSIPFQEYSDKYTHKKFTLGIAGRPGGPDFYVNMHDNVEIHGPGGQGHNYQGDPDSDSCFAKIVSGEDVALNIQKLPFKREGGLHILKDPVEILSMTIL